MKRLLCYLALSIAMTSCTGVPLRSLPRLMNLSQDLLAAKPAEFMVALQVDAHLVPPAGAVPMLIIKVTPREAGAADAIDRKLPLQVSVASSSTLGLSAPPNGRRWLIYSLPTTTQAELQRIQEFIKQAKAKPENKRGGSLSVGIEQASLAVAGTELAHTRWDTWLQIRQSEGFFEVWSGTPAQLQEAGG